jgi:hypothetical protein
MTAKTRRRVVVCAIAVGFALPTETVLLRAIATPDSSDAAQLWVSESSAAQLQAAASEVEQYPFAYRRAIMRALSPADRAAVWQRHFARYLVNHPELDPAVVAMLNDAAALATPDAFSNPTDEARAAIRAMAEEVQVVLGAAEADDLFYRLGPPDPASWWGLPAMQQMSDFVRRVFVVDARDDDCDCNLSFGCEGAATCSSGVSCTPDETWPMCGWFWNQVCNGFCVAGYSGSIGGIH